MSNKEFIAKLKTTSFGISLQNRLKYIVNTKSFKLRFLMSICGT